MTSVEDAGECVQVHEPMLVQTISLNSTPNGHDNMEIGEGNATVTEQVEAVSTETRSDTRAGTFRNDQCG